MIVLSICSFLNLLFLILRAAKGGNKSWKSICSWEAMGGCCAAGRSQW